MAVSRKIAIGFLAALLSVFTLPAAAAAPEELPLNPVPYANEGRDFQVMFTRGCGKLVTRANEPDLFGGQQWEDIIQVTHTYCDRYQTKGEGCSVTAIFNLHDEDNAMAGPEHVISRIEESLKSFGSKIVSQKGIKKDFGTEVIAEGVEVLAHQEKGSGEVWIRGLLIDGDIYILTAWKDQGGVLKNPDYIMFFNSFQPWVE